MLLAALMADQRETHIRITDARDQHLVVAELNADPFALREPGVGGPGLQDAVPLAGDAPARFCHQRAHRRQRGGRIGADGYGGVTQPAQLQMQDHGARGTGCQQAEEPDRGDRQGIMNRHQECGHGDQGQAQRGQEAEEHDRREVAGPINALQS